MKTVIKPALFALNRTLNEVNGVVYPRLRKWIKNRFVDELNDWAADSLSLKKDYDRALFVRLGYETFSDQWMNSLDAMVGLELHDSSLLIIDDIVDESPYRMGKPTLHIAQGTANAIMLAKVLKCTSLLALIESAQQNNLGRDQVYDLFRFVESVHADMYGGEYLDRKSESIPIEQVSVEDYLEVIRRTTGIHLGMALKVGAILANGDAHLVETLWKIGIRLGMLLQIRDDFVDYIDRDDVINKPSFGDFSRNKKRLPVLLAYQSYPAKMKDLQNVAVDEKVKTELKEIMSSKQVRDQCVEVVRTIYSDTDDLIRQLNCETVRDSLEDFLSLIPGTAHDRCDIP